MTRSIEQTLTAADGHHLGAYLVQPDGAPTGGVVILQEIFGVNAHTRHDVEFFAGNGYLSIAPALFDRVEAGAQLEYAETARGLAIANAIEEPKLLADLQAAIDAVASAGPVAVIGFCWGGALAWLAASKCRGVDRAVCYYGSRIAKFCESMKPSVPVMYHFGALDKSLPPEAIEKIRAVDPTGAFHVYPGADHAFTNSDRPSFAADAARRAHSRTLEFLGGASR
ncbi:MAG: dienelactone hydrolase family protein [Nitrospiraceae bacterium]|nr:dienelactone hydrolase family protein [Nitrospiraceae bacterium]